MRTGIVDVGGGLRGIYAAGILDYCMVQDIRFDCCIGVSAGSANMAAYLAGQQGRNYRYYQEYAFRKEYMGTGNLLHTGSYINLEYVYGTLSNADGEAPLDYPAIMDNPARLFVVATQAKTGEACYFTKADMSQDHYQILMASSCVPGVNRPYEKALSTAILCSRMCPGRGPFRDCSCLGTTFRHFPADSFHGRTAEPTFSCGPAAVILLAEKSHDILPAADTGDVGILLWMTVWYPLWRWRQSVEWMCGSLRPTGGTSGSST